MLRGLYTSAIGMMANASWLDIITNNLANLDTPTFKRQQPVFKEFPILNVRRIDDELFKTKVCWQQLRPEVGPVGTGVGLVEVAIDFSQGPIKQTNNPLDVAIDGSGFFVVKDMEGNVYYSRGGSFSVFDGYLVDSGGLRVQGEGGDIKVPYKNICITPDAQVIADISEKGDWQETKKIDNLRIVDFLDKTNLVKFGYGLYKLVKPQQELTSPARLLTGYLELSNVNPIYELSWMIEVHRLYEIDQKVVLSFDEALKTLLAEVLRG